MLEYYGRASRSEPLLHPHILHLMCSKVYGKPMQVPLLQGRNPQKLVSNREPRETEIGESSIPCLI